VEPVTLTCGCGGLEPVSTMRTTSTSLHTAVVSASAPSRPRIP